VASLKPGWESAMAPLTRKGHPFLKPLVSTGNWYCRPADWPHRSEAAAERLCSLLADPVHLHSSKYLNNSKSLKYEIRKI